MTMVIAARNQVALPAEELFSTLADLDRHRVLTDHGMQILSLDGPPGARTGGVVELRGPMGLRRLAQTSVRGAEPARRLWGGAVTPNGTEAELEWLLAPSGDTTQVEVRMRLMPRDWRDHVLLRLGGARWLRQRLVAALARLEQTPLG